MLKRRTTLYFLLLLLVHVAHVFEEVWGRFFLLDKYFGLGWYLIGNWLLIGIPIFVFYNFLNDKRWAYYLSLIYAYVMIINGLGHNVMTLLTGKYFDGFAGGFTGIGLIIIGLLFQHNLRKLIKENNNRLTT